MIKSLRYKDYWRHLIKTLENISSKLTRIEQDILRLSLDVSVNPKIKEAILRIQHIEEDIRALKRSG